ncbi:hypothetical protein BWI15_22900 [Kribbella sp. ALI-6-A]|uniref:HutD/Ves family protein n=1 Tax=Kribbella sp. ALI-6-A TaxID=1933817 RepID=UPI00097C0415|nr:HutD family protein [Kribbella sp. ALI-6-A]ONI69431.1 hypothetical protein BWI15_22900 [Kribbella sp. ALI-6-A]
MSLRYRRASEQNRVAWRNGAGLTTELASDPPGGGATTDFVWRVSMAEVVENCDFSVFPDVDRTILLVEGESMSLQLSGTEHALTRFEPFSFDGGVDVRCRVPGPTRDLNVMTRRGRASATVVVEQVLGARPLGQADHLVIVGVDGSVSLQAADATVTVASGDVVELDEPALVTGSGHLAVIRVRTNS